jgi:DNA-binding XRE family transcriptional regulator
MQHHAWVYQRSADAIRDALQQVGWSQRNLARHLDVSEATVSGWVNGHTLPSYHCHLTMSFYFGWPHPALPSMTTGVADAPGIYLVWRNPNAPRD